MINYFIGILILFLSAVFSIFIKKQNVKLIFITILSIISACFILFDSTKVFLNGAVENVFSYGPIFQNCRFVLDNLSAFFAIFISVVSSLGLIYSNGYLKNYLEKNKDISAHCVFLPILIASMLGVVIAQNALLFLIIWEMMSLSSFFLVLFENEKKDVLKAGVKYLVFMHVSVIFIMIMFAILATQASSLDFNEFKKVLENNIGLSNLIFIFAFIGFGIKAGFVPFHNWLPDAHPAAPSHVSGLMSGVMIKTGIYGILRILDLIQIPSCQIAYFVLIISTITALYGILYAISQNDLKKLLAYSSIENIGIIGIGIGIGMLGLAYENSIVAMLGFAGGILHILNHSIFKSLLFFAAGSVYARVHTRDMEILGGLIKSMPKTAILFLIASVSICALPPFNGFISEFLIYFGMLKAIMIDNLFLFLALILALAGLALVGTMAILCFTKVFSVTFLGEARCEKAREIKADNGTSFIAPMAILAILALLIGILPQHILNFILRVTLIFVDTNYSIEIIPIIKTIAIVSSCLLATIALIYMLKAKIEGKKEEHVTWGCGYNKVGAEMEYSASSYSEPFITMLKPLFKRVSDIQKPKTLFPKEAHWERHMEDVEEAYFIKPLMANLEGFFARFEQIQDGNIQRYIMYGLIFLVVSLIAVVLIG